MSVQPSQQRTGRGFPLARGLVVASAAAVVAGLVASLTIGASYALWSHSASLDAAVIATGSLTLTADPDGVFDNTAWDDMLPGDRISQPLKLHNGGTVSSDISVSLSESSDWLTIAVVAGECPTDGIPDISDDFADGAIGLGLWDADENDSICIEVTMNSDTPQSALTDDLSFRLLFTAKQHI